MSAAAQADQHVWIGIGKMGLPMAGRIAAAGYRW
jgi:3-hydroxyisobutyrate dehydrogenase-like beta-hydroxyacid dehydrogenase